MDGLNTTYQWGRTDPADPGPRARHRPVLAALMTILGVIVVLLIIVLILRVV